MSNKAWLIRPKPNGVTRISEFLEDQIIAVGWPGLGDLSGTREYELKQKLKEVYPENASALSALKMIVYRMTIGDFVLVPQEDSIFFGEIVSDYLYEETKDEAETGFPHQRKVEWYDLVLSREELPLELQKSTRVVRTAAELTKHQIAIVKLLEEHKAKKREISKKDKSDLEGNSALSVESVTLLEKAEEVLHTELKNEDPYVRLKAAEVIVSFLKKEERAK